MAIDPLRDYPVIVDDADAIMARRNIEQVRKTLRTLIHWIVNSSNSPLTPVDGMQLLQMLEKD